MKEFFVDLPDDLTAEITHLRAKISELKNADTIRNLKKLTKLPLMSSLIFKRFPEKELDELQAWVISKLNKQIAISRETLEKITEYLNDLPQSLGEDWLQSGAEVEVLDECPFCGQGLENDGGRINHLRNYFKDESYREKKSEIGKIIELCSRERLLENARDLEADNRENQEVLAKWNQIYDDQKISLKLELDTSRIEDPLTTLLDFLESKRKEPVGRINEDETQLIQEYFEAINGIDEKIGEYNRNIERQNQRIKSAKKRNRNQGDSNLSKLREKMRFTVLALHCKNNDDSAIDDLIQKREDLNKLQRQYDELKDERKEQFQQDADIYGDNVDEYIKRFNRDFGVDNFTIRYHGQSKIPSSEMRFSLNGVEISNDVSARSLNMRTALSTSDRRVLALSLFLSKLESMNNLPEQLVVLDDPFSSFDSPNRHSIMRELAELSKRVKQLIILTHDLRFGFKLSQALKKKDKEGVTILKIERQDKSSSIIKNFSDISAVDISDHLQRLETIEGYIEGQHQDAKKAVKEARPVLERYLRTKYSNVHDCKNLGCIIGRMKAMNFIGEERIAILEDLNDYLPEFSHDDLSDPKYSVLEIENYLEKTIEYIKE